MHLPWVDIFSQSQRLVAKKSPDPYQGLVILLLIWGSFRACMGAMSCSPLLWLERLLWEWVSPQPTCQKFPERRKFHPFDLRTLNLINILVPTRGRVTHTHQWWRFRYLSPLTNWLGVDLLFYTSFKFFIFCIANNWILHHKPVTILTYPKLSTYIKMAGSLGKPNPVGAGWDFANYFYQVA